MYEKQLAFIHKRIDEFTEKAHLKKSPKLQRYKGMIPASANGILNRLYISDNFLEQWQQGFYDEKDADALLAHEFGHLIAYQKSRFEAAKGSLAFLYFMLLPITLVFYWSLRILEPGVVTAVIILCWLFFLPWIVQRSYVPGEFEADRNAIAFGLADAQQLADALLKRMSMQWRRNLGPAQTLERLWSMLTHPSLDETLQNIGLGIGRTVEIRRI